MPDAMPLSTTPDENRQEKDVKGLMLPPPLPSKDGHSTPTAPPRMTRLPSLKELSTHLHYTPSSTSSAQLPNPLATPDRNRVAIPATPPSLRISTNPSALTHSTPGGSSPLVAPSPSGRLKLPASAMMRSLSSGPSTSGAGLTMSGLNSASASPIDRRSSLAFGALDSIRSPARSSGDFAGSKDIFANVKPAVDSSPVAADASTSMSRVSSMDAYVQGYKDMPSLDQIRRRVSISRAKSFTASVSGSVSKPKTEDKKPVEKSPTKEVQVDSPPETASQASSSSDEGVTRKKKEHPLQHAWTLYFDSKTYKPDPSLLSGKDASLLADYEKTLATVGRFETVEGFARYLNNVRLPSALAKNSNYHMFKNGIRPMWEDPANANGGKWVILFRSSPPTLDVAWANLTMALVGEILDPEDQVCGIVASSRPKIDRIQIWTRGREDVEKLNALGRRVVDAMALEGRDAEAMSMEFQPNRMASGSHGSGLGTGMGMGMGLSLNIPSSPSVRGPNSPSFPPPKSPTHLNVPPPGGDPAPPPMRGRLGSNSGASNAFAGPMGGMAMGRLGSGSPLKKEGSPAPGVVAGGSA